MYTFTSTERASAKWTQRCIERYHFEVMPKDGIFIGTKITVSDIAKVVGVSPSTVSRVLTNGSRSEYISEETRHKVRDAALQLGYTPNPLARALKGGRSNLIGLILREIADPFFAQLIQEISNVVQSSGYQIVLGYSRGNSDGALKMSNILDTRYVDGVIVLGDLIDDERMLAAILEQNPAVIALCRSSSPKSVITVNTNNYAGIEALFNHLYDLGHRRIAFLEGDWMGDIPQRRRAFVECMSARQLSIADGWVQKVPDNFKGGYQGLQNLLDRSDLPTAVMASDDTIAIGAIKALVDAGLHTPRAMSVTGYDDIDLAAFVSPSLTTVRQPIDRMAKQAVEALISLITLPKLPLSETMLHIQPELVIRDSTARPPLNLPA
jgi:DNA-binding LacI/PurR family transcriptional regulator